MERTHAWPAGHWDWPIHLPYKHGLRVGNLVFVGGQAALDEHGDVLFPGDLPKQTVAVMENIKRVLAELGATMDDVVKVNTFYVGTGSVGDWSESALIRARYFTEPGPVATGIAVPYMWKEMMIEVEVIAVVNDASPAPKQA